VQADIIKFDEFELDLGRYELRRRGQPLKLEKVPMELLILLAEREGQLVTREEIVQKLWGQDVFVDTRQGVNTAVRKIRLALKDDPDNPRILQTVFGKGYRLVAPVETAGGARPPSPRTGTEGVVRPYPVPLEQIGSREPQRGVAPDESENRGLSGAKVKTAPVDPRLARALFLLIQVGYLALYAAALFFLGDIRRLGLPPAVPGLTVVAGLIGTAVRLYLISAVAFNYVGSGRLFRQAWPGILILDALWAASPLFLFYHWGELTLLAVAGLVFLPFSQRTLMRSAYGAPEPDPQASK
jgi:cholera toxin transcriptional activator